MFGKVIKNMEYLDLLENREEDNSQPKEPITIVDCGEIKQEEGITVEPADQQEEVVDEKVEEKVEEDKKMVEEIVEEEGG